LFDESDLVVIGNEFIGLGTEYQIDAILIYSRAFILSYTQSIRHHPYEIHQTHPLLSRCSVVSKSLCNLPCNDILSM